MLTYMLDTNISIYVMKNYPLELREIQFTDRATLYLQHHTRRVALWRGGVGTPHREPDRHRTFHGASRSVAVRGQGGCALRPGSRRTETPGNALRPARHADRRSRAQPGVDHRHQQHARVRAHAGDQGLRTGSDRSERLAWWVERSRPKKLNRSIGGLASLRGNSACDGFRIGSTHPMG